MKKRFLWIIEFLIWALIILVVSFFIQYKHSMHVRQSAMGHVFFKDTNGLIVGSPVKFMGVQVGYVSELKIVNDETYVTFVITQKNMKIPQGTIASIEFTGLAGSISLELFPPTLETIGSGRPIHVVEPIRIKNFMERQSNIAMDIMNMSNDVNLIITKNNIHQIQNLLRTREIFNNAYRGLDNINVLEDKTLDMLHERQEQRKNGIKKR